MFNLLLQPILIIFHVSLHTHAVLSFISCHKHLKTLKNRSNLFKLTLLATFVLPFLSFATWCLAYASVLKWHPSNEAILCNMADMSGTYSYTSNSEKKSLGQITKPDPQDSMTWAWDSTINHLSPELLGAALSLSPVCAKETNLVCLYLHYSVGNSPELINMGEGWNKLRALT